MAADFLLRQFAIQFAGVEHFQQFMDAHRLRGGVQFQLIIAALLHRFAAKPNNVGAETCADQRRVFFVAHYFTTGDVNFL